MAKSKIIKELANGTVTLPVALKRAKLLLQEFDNEDLLLWVNYELTGYPSVDVLPEYRKKQGQLKGTYLKGSMANHMKYTNVSIPIGKMPDHIAKVFLEIPFTEGVEALANFIESSKDQTIGKQIPADYFPNIAYYNDDPFMYIVSARVEISIQCVQGILTIIESKLLDLFCYLEKQFGVLDELDIDVGAKTEAKQNEILEHISTLIYNDNRITIGDNCKIKDTTISPIID